MRMLPPLREWVRLIKRGGLIVFAQRVRLAEPDTATGALSGVRSVIDALEEERACAGGCEEDGVCGDRMRHAPFRGGGRPDDAFGALGAVVFACPERSPTLAPLIDIAVCGAVCALRAPHLRTLDSRRDTRSGVGECTWLADSGWPSPRSRVNYR